MTKPRLITAAVLLAAACLALAYWFVREAPEPPPIAVTCADPQAGCTAQVEGRPVRIGLVGPLRPLQPFHVWVEAPGAGAVTARFDMVGMNMGFNRYALRPDVAGVFRARVTLPVCVSGRRDWVMTVDINGGTRLAVPFATTL
ncbi:MAG: hypothetical protein PHS77_07020 [Gallionellaceae bacterium]|nr:hypothetical protein [Gallionellaceae bacterium]